jgi:hypothetical protein
MYSRKQTDLGLVKIEKKHQHTKEEKQLNKESRRKRAIEASKPFDETKELEDFVYTGYQLVKDKRGNDLLSPIELRSSIELKIGSTLRVFADWAIGDANIPLAKIAFAIEDKHIIQEEVSNDEK